MAPHLEPNLQAFDVVRVKALAAASREFTGTNGVSRAPRVGDIATVCHVYDCSDPQAAVAVEMVDREGRTIWLADFLREELELVSRQA